MPIDIFELWDIIGLTIKHKLKKGEFKMANGAKTWYLPEKTDGAMEAHEALMILNVNKEVANVRLTSILMIKILLKIQK